MKLKKKKIKFKLKKVDRRKTTYLRKRKMPKRTHDGIAIPENWEFGKGRIKGTKNKFTTLKRAFVDVFNSTGGVTGMRLWVNSNDDQRTAFYRMLSRMLPREVNIGTVDEVSPYNFENMSDKEIDAILAGVIKVRGGVRGKR